MTNRDEARRTLLDILNRLDEIGIQKLLIVFTTDNGPMGFGGAGLDAISVIGMAEMVKDMARAGTQGKAVAFTPFSNMPVGGPKPQ